MMIDMSVSPRALSDVASSGPVEKSAAPVSRETAHRRAASSWSNLHNTSTPPRWAKSPANWTPPLS
ncbi:hypothetical protein [Pseudomonas lundensis]|uniref:hypothetical protein n=1 Tax=Pseudomonas lundensis TaxID=86185 RepID=UPI0011401694|nr:hypothetical protein [Pseudomonas lundensis]